MSQVVRWPAAPRGRVLELGPAIDEFLASPDFAETTVVSYGRTLEALREHLGADADAAGVGRAELKAHLESRYGHTAPATYNRHLAAIGSLFGWLVDEEAIGVSPAAGLRRRKDRITSQRERQDRALPYDELQARWRDPRHRLRDRALWALAYSTAARVDELLGLDVEDLDLRNRTAPILGKGGDIERIFWDSEAARLLKKLVGGRTGGPVFLAERPPVPSRMPAAADIDPDTGRARLSYRRAEEIFTAAFDSHTIHQLRHSRLTHLAEAGEDATMLRAKSRHRSLRSLERYTNPSDRAIAALTDRHDPNSRRRRRSR